MIYVIRHGETDYNKIGRLQGKRDISLNETGIMQAYEIKNRLYDVDFDEIYSSDLNRAYKTAEIIADGKRVIKDSRLEEIGLGRWEGQTYDFLRANDPEYVEFFNDPKNFNKGDNESYQSVIDRVKEFFDELDNDKNILVVTHGFVIYHYFQDIFPQIEPVKNCEIILYDKLNNKIIRNKK